MPPRRAPSSHVFTAKIVRFGMMYGVDVPATVSRAFSKRGWVPVAGTVNRKTPFRASLAPRGGGRHMLMLNGEVRRAAGVAPGDRVTLALSYDDQPRDVPVPEDVAFVLRDEGVLDAFLAITPGRRGHIIKWVEQAVHEVTRDKRIARVVEIAEAEREKRLDREATAAAKAASRAAGRAGRAEE
jgi:hypothetical protein